MGDYIPWSGLSEREKRNVQTDLWARGITVSIEEAEEYYGNKEKVVADQEHPPDPAEYPYNCPRCWGPLNAAMLAESGFNCPHCGDDLSGDRDDG